MGSVAMLQLSSEQLDLVQFLIESNLVNDLEIDFKQEHEELLDVVSKSRREMLKK